MDNGSQQVIVPIASQRSLYGKLARWKKMEEFILKNSNFVAIDLEFNRLNSHQIMIILFRLVIQMIEVCSFGTFKNKNSLHQTN